MALVDIHHRLHKVIQKDQRKTNLTCFSPVCQPFPHGTVCSLIITIKELQHWLITHQDFLLWHIWAVLSLKSRNWIQLYCYTHRASFSWLLLQYDKPKESQMFIKMRHSLALLLLYSQKVFEPLFLSMMKLFPLVAPFSPFLLLLYFQLRMFYLEYLTHSFFVSHKDSG